MASSINVPENYVCIQCGKRGHHWIMKCSLNNYKCKDMSDILKEDQIKQLPTYTFKLMSIGDGYVGKTSYLHRISTSKLQYRYIPTIGCDVSQLQFYTTIGRVINCWDTADKNTVFV